MFGIDWNPLSWLRSAQHVALASFDDVKKWVLAVVKDAAHGLTVAFDDIVSGVSSGIDDAVNLSWALYHDAVSGVTYAVGQVANGVGYILSEAENYALGLYHDALAAANYIGQQAQAAATAEWHVLYDTIMPLWHEYLAPVYHFMAHYADDVWHIIDWWWQHIDMPILDGIRHVADMARHDAASAGDWIVHVGDDVAHLVFKAEDWLIWMGEHTITDLEHLPGDVANLFSLSGIMYFVTSSVESTNTTVTDLADKIFGA